MPLMLGKKPPKHDPRTLMLGKYVDTAKLGPPPATVDWYSKVSAARAQERDAFPMYRNDEIGDCGFAGPAHLRQVWTANDGKIITPTEDSVLEAYQNVTGWDGNPQSPTDQGVVMLDMLNYWRNKGMFGSRIAAYAKVDHHDLDLVKHAIHLFGGVLLGVSLPRAVQEQTNETPWKAPTKGPYIRQWQPGSWGGHCVLNSDYTNNGSRSCTWGGLKMMSWNFFSVYVDECYVCLSRDWLGPDSKAPNGFNAIQLSKDLGLLK